MTQRQTESLAQAVRGAPQWLTSAAESPIECRTHWLAQPSVPQLLGTGATFDAVVVADDLGVYALEGYRQISSPALPAVIDHRARKVAFLVASCGADFFADTVASMHGTFTYRYLDLGDYVLIPRTAARGRRSSPVAVPAPCGLGSERGCCGDAGGQPGHRGLPPRQGGQGWAGGRR
jgi:hypothetical protein